MDCGVGVGMGFRHRLKHGPVLGQGLRHRLSRGSDGLGNRVFCGIFEAGGLHDESALQTSRKLRDTCTVLEDKRWRVQHHPVSLWRELWGADHPVSLGGLQLVSASPPKQSRHSDSRYSENTSFGKAQNCSWSFTQGWCWDESAHLQASSVGWETSFSIPWVWAPLGYHKTGTGAESHWVNPPHFQRGPGHKGNSFFVGTH